MSPQHQRYVIVERSQVADARARVQQMARTAGLSDEVGHRAGIVVTELAGNLIKHATDGGQILLRAIMLPAGPAIECLALDSGPGIPDVTRSLRDGHSTAASPGNGLGAVRRLSTQFDVYSSTKGTGLLAVVGAERPGAIAAGPFEVGGVCVALAGEELSGDGWEIVQRDDTLAVMLSDGLGHGLAAHEASRDAADLFRSRADASCDAALERIHRGMSHTRGAAIGMAMIGRATGRLTFAGVGNVAGIIAEAGHRRPVVSTNGTVGHGMPAFKEFAYPWTGQSVFVMHSDGLTSRWSLEDYPGLIARHPALVAGVLFRDWSRERDDASVVVVRQAA